MTALASGVLGLVPVLAQAVENVPATSSGLDSLLGHILSVVVFSAIGMVVFGVALWLFNRLCPFSLRKELEEDQNTALGIIIGALIIGMAIIIAAAVHG